MTLVVKPDSRKNLQFF